MTKENWFDGYRLAKVVTNSGMTFKDVAKKAKISPATLLSWVNEGREPGSVKLARVCDVLQISADWVLHRRPSCMNIAKSGFQCSYCGKFSVNVPERFCDKCGAYIIEKGGK